MPDGESGPPAPRRPAVAENQPQTFRKPKNRMSELLEIGDYAARACAFITAAAAHSLFPDTDAFNALARELFALQFRLNAPYRRFCQARGADPESLTDWTQLPAIHTAAFKCDELTLLSPGARATFFQSSGTTAQRSRHFHHAITLGLYETSLLAWFGQCMPGLEKTATQGRWISLTPTPAQAPYSSLAHMLGKVVERWGGEAAVWTGYPDSQGGWCVDLEATTKALAKASSEGQPVTLLGTAFSFVHLLDYATERRLAWPLPSGSVVMESGGYKGRSRVLPKAQLHAEISHRLGLPRERIVCEYGMCELSSQAYDCAPGPATPPAGNASAERAFHFPPWARVRLVSPEHGGPAAVGETGLIQIIDLANLSSVVALQTEDLGVREPSGFRLLGRAIEAEARGCSLMAV